MKTRLNLYIERFRPRHLWLNRWVLLGFMGVFVLLLSGGAIGLYHVNQTLAEQHQLLSSQQEQLQTRLLDLSKRVQRRQEDQGLIEAIARQSRLISSKRQLLSHLDKSPLLTELRFSKYMQGLSNSHVQGLWLTRVRADDKDLILDGRSLSEELLPQWLHRLSSQVDFHGKKFGVLELSRPRDGQTPHLDFHLSTQLKRAEDGNG